MLKSVPLSAEHRRVGAARFQVTKGSIRKQSIEKLRFLRKDVPIADVKMELRGYTRLPPGIRAEATVFRAGCGNLHRPVSGVSA